MAIAIDRGRHLFLTLVALFTTFPLAAEVELTFLPNRSVRHESSFHVAVEQQLPSGIFEASMEQRLAADLSIVDRSDLPVRRPPLNMLFTLRDLDVELAAGGLTSSFSMKSPGTSLFLAEIQNMMNDPIKLHFGDNFSLDPHTSSLQQLTKELPILQAIHPHSFVEEFFHHLFSLAARDLFVGMEVTLTRDEESVGVAPTAITYRVTKIDGDTIVATFSGKSSKVKFGIPFQLSIGDVDFDGVELSVAADMEGELSWNRRNALLYSLVEVTTYSGKYQVGQWKSATKVTATHRVKSQEVGKGR